MFFGFIVLLTGLIISGISAYYSIIGLTAIFAAAFWPIVIMGGVLEIGKIVSTVWLHINWKRAPWRYKAYLAPAVIVLMLITSMGIFGFLSKAHLDQTVPTGDVAAQVSLIDEKIKTQRDNIATAKLGLEQLNDQVNSLMTKTFDDRGVERSIQVRRNQAKERTTLQKEIDVAQKEITKLQDQRAPINAQLRKVEAEVGPVKYIAALIYGDNPDANLLERAVRWVIITIVLVFDPLALILILAATLSFEWHREDKKKKETPKVPAVESASAPPPPVVANNVATKPMRVEPDLTNLNKELNALETEAQWDVIAPAPDVKVEPELLAEPIPEAFPEPIVASEPIPEAIPEPVAVPEIVVEPPRVSETAVRHKAPVAQPPEARANFDPVPDNVETAYKPKSTFGIEFPLSPVKGDTCLRVDIFPSRLYKWNGGKWIEVDRKSTDSYAYDEEYIAFLVKQLELGNYEVDDLSSIEQEQVKNFLSTR